MNRRHGYFLLTAAIFGICLFYLWETSAEAARVGGGKSFGSRPSYQRSAPAPSPSPSSPQMSPGQPSQPAPGMSPSPMGRWGGMLGGLVMGGLIGSLLFGGGHAWGGPGLMDLLLVGGGLFLLFRFLRARREATASASGAGSMSFDRTPAQGWGGAGLDPSAATTPVGSEPATIPPGFDAEEFLKGAKAIYTRLQASWDKRDLADIRQFTSPEVYEEIERQAQEDPGPSKTELILITPKILEVRELDGQTIVSVLYDVMMRERRDEMTRQVRELWHFSRDARAADAFWVLEGIQQVE